MNLGPGEIAFLILIIVLLFGAKKLPDAARSIGRSMRIFKSEISEMSKDGDTDPQGQISSSQPSYPTQSQQPYPQQGQQPQFHTNQQPTNYQQ